MQEKAKASEARMDKIKSLAEIYEGCLMADGFEEALIGFGTRFTTPVAIYNVSKCIDILVERDGMSYEIAEEYMTFNVLGAYVGDSTPIFLEEFVDGADDRQAWLGL
tara:strand:+ start:100 stop:420 length:321 start_codon:yes stop_codon:yes gene_type:complete